LGERGLKAVATLNGQLRMPFQAPPVRPERLVDPPSAFAIANADPRELERIRAALRYGADINEPARFVVPFIAHRKQW
jgi:cyanobactin biosynthesis protein (PatB/AcyB/McaB family)